MQLTVAEAAKNKLLKDAGMTVPSSTYTSKILGKDIDIDSSYNTQIAGNVLVEIWNKQHPVMHTWLVLSSISICFLSALFFIIP